MTDAPDNVVNLTIIGGAVDAAETAPPPPREDGRRADAPPGDAGRGGGAGESPQPGLPGGCPVTALGHENDTCFYLDSARQLRELKARDHSRLGIVKLFGARKEFLYDAWPRYGKPPEKDMPPPVVGWKPELVAEALMAAAALAGVWDPFKKVRGAGAWTGRAGELVYHCGDRVLVFPETGGWDRRRDLAPGMIDGYVYPAYGPVPGPSPAQAEVAAAEEVLSVLNTWAWRRGETDARLLLGWLGAAMLGGALAWRPAAWITGGKGTGKSTLHQIIRDLLGEGAVSVSDASAAGVWQELKWATLPVLFDEAEASEDNRKMDKIVALARQAASGGMVLRGGADHGSSKFVARSCFMFSSINVPPLEPADLSRMAILELGELRGRPPLKIKPARLNVLGEAMRRRLVDGWARLPVILQGYREALQAEGLTARGADQFGTLLAVADVMLCDHDLDPDFASEWAARVAPEQSADWDADAGRDEIFMITHLLTSAIETYRSGARQTVGEWINRAAYGKDEDLDRKEANKVLGTIGLRVIWRTDRGAAAAGPLDGRPWLAISQRHAGLSEIFKGTHWGGRASATNVWVQAARRLTDAVNADSPMKFGGAAARAVLVPVDVVLPDVEADGMPAGAEGAGE